MTTIDADAINKSKFPALSELLPYPAEVTLLAKMKLDLNLNISDFFFNNTSFFETRERRMIECITTIYSFGTIVLEAKEVQHALWVNEGKFMYSFLYVNQFFDAFMKGIRTLQSWEEVDIAINNLCIVQVFEDVETKTTSLATPHDTMMAEASQTDSTPSSSSQVQPQPPSSSPQQLLFTPATQPAAASAPTSAAQDTKRGERGAPLLVMLYEFERGHGTIDISAVSDANAKTGSHMLQFTEFGV